MTTTPTFKKLSEHYFTAFSEQGVHDAVGAFLQGRAAASVDFPLGPLEDVTYPADFKLNRYMYSIMAVKCAPVSGPFQRREAKPEVLPDATYLGNGFYIAYSEDGLKTIYHHVDAHECGWGLDLKPSKHQTYPVLVNVIKDGESEFRHSMLALPQDFKDVLDLMSTKIVNQSKA